MAPQNLYLSYKKDTKYLLYWMINVSNRLVKSSEAESSQTSVTVNTTGQTTVNGLISMSKLIAERSEPVPNVIYRLFGSIIQARSLVSTAFRQLMGPDPDDELKRSNESHQHFIDTLGQAFRILGGDEWEQKQTTATDESNEDVEQIRFANKFQDLTVEQYEASSDEEEEVQVHQANSVARKVSRKPGKGKKGKKAKKTKKPKKNRKQEAADTGNDEVPIESIRIIEDGDSLVTDYLIAVYSAVKEWVDLRGYIQNLWKEVAYEGLNSAVAGAVSNMAISMIQRTNAAIFVDFPGHDSYETIMRTITRGNLDKAQGAFTLAMYQVVPNGGPTRKAKETAVDIKEQFLIHAYQDLIDFIHDFQANRSGKPTKAMQAKIAKWDPSFNLQKATEEERLNWRRCYTIKWLYDLVNVFSSVVVQRNTMKGENHVYERVNWSANGPWGHHRTVFGLSEFAGDVTSMAMKKPGTDIRKMIYPHHVFQLQCIVDSLTASRGWTLNALHGHVLQPPAKSFRPRRDVDLFLDRNNKRIMAGYCQSVDLLKQMFENEGKMNQHGDFIEVLKLVQQDFIDFLGEHKYMYGLKTIPPSRFSDHSANGLYEYSPFLCGVGLEEGLELAYRLGMLLWDRIPEPMLLIHLHNALVEKGYLSQPIGLYQSLADLFKESFFADGRLPTSDFGDAFLAKAGQPGSRQSQAQRQALGSKRRLAINIHRILDLKANHFFKRNSTLIACRMANWNLEAIPDEELPFPSALFLERLGRAKQVVDSVTNKPRLENTALVRRAKAAGVSDKEILEMADTAKSLVHGQDEMVVPPSLLENLTPAGYRQFPSTNSITPGVSKKDAGFSGRDLLDLAKLDIATDVCGTSPYSSLNYVGVTCWLLIIFKMMEDRLKTARNSLYAQAYENPGPWQKEKRVGLTLLALTKEDDECLRIMAEVLDKQRTGFMDLIYWEDLDTEPRKKAKSNDAPGFSNECTVM